MKKLHSLPKRQVPIEPQLLVTSYYKNHLIVTLKDGNDILSVHLSVDDILQFQRTYSKGFTTISEAVEEGEESIKTELALLELDLAPRQKYC